MQNPETPETPGVHALDYLTVLRRRWYISATIFAVVVGTAGWINLRLPPVYEAWTKVTFRPAAASMALPEHSSPFERVLLQNLSFESQKHIIASTPVVRQIAERLGRLSEDMTPDQEQSVYNGVRAALRVDRLKETSILQITTEASDPQVAARMADIAAEVYVDINRQREQEALSNSLDWLTTTLVDVTGKLHSSEEAWLNYARHNNIPIDNINMSSAASRASRTAANVAAFKDELAQIDAELASLQRRYKHEHPQVASLKRERSRLLEQLRGQEKNVVNNNQSIIELGALRGEADVNRGIRDLLVRRLTETHLTSGIADSTIQIIEGAKVPKRPVRPNRIKNMGLAVTAAVLLAVAFAFFADYMDQSFKGPDDVERVLGLPTLATLRHLRSVKERSDLPFLLGNEKSFVREAEAFRTLRTSLRFAYAGEDRRLLLVTSAGPSEGKSTVAINLAFAIAKANQRVIIVDTDFRRPSLHKAFRLKNQNGLADVLAGDITLENAVRANLAENLDVLPRGSRPPNPSEILDSKKMHNTLADLRERYDVVILDSPPIGSVVDASVLAAQVEGIILVIEAGRLPAKYLQRVKRRVDQVGARVYGVVLNKVRATASAYGDYYYYYYYSNYHYYDSEEEEAESAGIDRG